MMKIHLAVDGVAIDARWEQEITQYAQALFSRFGSRIAHIYIRVEHHSDHTFGHTTRCQVSVLSKPLPPLAIEHRQHSVSDAVTWALHRAHRAYAHHWKRRGLLRSNRI